MKKIVLLLVILFQITAIAQSNRKRADGYFEDFKFKKAIEFYQRAASNSKNVHPDVMRGLANSYFNIAAYKEAKEWYEKLYSETIETMDEPTFIRYIQSLKSNQEYEKANSLIKQYYRDNTERMRLIEFQKKHLDSLLDNEAIFRIDNLLINSNKSDFAPAYYKNNVVFASSRDTTKAMQRNYSWNDQPFLDPYVATIDQSTGQLRNTKKFLENLDSSFHEATMTFSPDFKTVYFTRNYASKRKLKVNKEGVSNIQILKGTIKEGKITDVVPLNFNSKEYSCGHPSISSGGTHLYFASDMPGGFGGSDIYVCEIKADGTMGTPVNLGSYINTPGREMFPFALGEDLYFASDTHFGLGGLDIFKAEQKSVTKYTMPVNLGRPINSNMDDFAYIENESVASGYFSSNRAMGKGDDDIYYFELLTPKAFQLYSGQIMDKNANTAIPFATVKVYNKQNTLEKEIVANEKGEYSLKLPLESEFTIVFTKPGYTQHTTVVKTLNAPNAESKKNLVLLVSFEQFVVKEGDVEKIKVNPIFFESFKYNITPQAEVELQKIIVAMNSFPKIRIRIESHTDSRGADLMNYKLSNQRARSTYDYLIANGIDPSRIESAIGYGETELKNYCINGFKCTEDEHLINRRSDFIIVSK
ncbi:OmpA family protein [Aquimarina sp. W85]|uniref:OmpA family protein n=1 Tax=Aquimarina rhodophyticola TaxID=3342246 RepID=UPI00366D9939